MKISIHPVVGKVITTLLTLAAICALAYLLAEPASRMWHQLRPNEVVTPRYAFDYVLWPLLGLYAFFEVFGMVFRYLYAMRKLRMLAKRWDVSVQTVEEAIKLGILKDRDVSRISATQFSVLWATAQSRQSSHQTS